ncbi:hypothetical protein E2C01_041446 [Portunus trituberculatus]|uniref:Uncharacterized protein n=1 Tax=Portunus trituberculatus TaxID=210409 RepID=A0A5B7FMM4_PORTR|nr:hypothetical protein [Portunus trituberculatus]
MRKREGEKNDCGWNCSLLHYARKTKSARGSVTQQSPTNAAATLRAERNRQTDSLPNKLGRVPRDTDNIDEQKPPSAEGENVGGRTPIGTPDDLFSLVSPVSLALT